MGDDHGNGICLLIGWVAGMFTVSVLVLICDPREDGRRVEREAAVKAGAGYYVSDPATGDVKFVYGAKL